MSSEQIASYSSLVKRRINHEPTAYITGHKEFFGIDFTVTPDTIIPRPDTELLVENAIELARTRLPESCLIGDIGTGCGAIAIALARHLPRARIYATDISAPALEVARSNCHRHGVSERVILLQGDVLEPLPEPVHLIVSNLPYIRESELPTMPPEIAMYEPRIAFAGGKDGLRLVERLLSQVSRRLLNDGAVLIEIGYDQGLAVSELARKYFPNAEIGVATDLSGLDRLVCISLLSS
jgi:release factor glutamine methyltransferase